MLCIIKALLPNNSVFLSDVHTHTQKKPRPVAPMEHKTENLQFMYPLS